MKSLAASRLPYPGLRAYAREETDLFFGRESCVNEMVDRLSATHFLAVLGASGSGKSSLVRTGLLDALEIGLMANAGVAWTVAECHPGGSPTRNLAEALIGTRPDAPADTFGIGALESFLRRGPRSIIQWVDDGNLPAGQNLLLLVDQFEELFRYSDYAGREEAESFIALLLESASYHARIYVVMTMRSEYLGACALMPGFAERINESIYLTRRMTLDECREAIIGPAAVLGFKIEPRLVTRLLNDLSSFAPWDNDRETSQLERLSRQADQLPLMQHVLNRLWLRAAKAAGDGQVTLKLTDYLAIGQLQGALDQHGAEIMETLGEAKAAVAEAVFRGLIAGPSLASAVRRPTPLRELQALAGGDGEDVRAVVEAFRGLGANFLRPAAIEPLHDDSLVDISHESLIRQWTVLARWLEKEAKDSATWRRLQADANSEHDGERQLLSGIDLENAQSWWNRSRPGATWAERHDGQYELVRGFLDRSLAREKAAQAEAAQRERGARNRAWTVAAALSVLLLGSLATGGLYWQSQGTVRARNTELLAANDRVVAEKDTADRQRDAAQRATELAISAADRFLTDLTQQFQDTAAIQPEKLKKILEDGDRFLEGMSGKIGESPQLAWVQARLLLKFAELSLEDDLPTAIKRLDRVRTLLANPAVAKMDGADIIQGEMHRLSSLLAFTQMDWLQAEAQARQAVNLFGTAPPLIGEKKLAASRAHWAVARALWRQKKYSEAQSEADACTAALDSTIQTNETQFGGARCIHMKALVLSDGIETTEAELQSALVLYRQELVVLDQLIASDETNIAVKDLKAAVLNNMASSYRAKDPMRFVSLVGQAAALTEQALERASWSTRLKSSVAHYDYWIGKTLRDNKKPLDALIRLSRARELQAELVHLDPTNAGWQDSYEDSLTESRAAYIDADKSKVSRADVEDRLAVERTLLQRHLAQNGPAPLALEPLLVLVEDHSRLAEALRAAGQSAAALEQARLGAKLVDDRAFTTGSDPRLRYWAHWLREAAVCTSEDTADMEPVTRIAFCEDSNRFLTEFLAQEPRDWLTRDSIAMAQEVIARAYLMTGRKAEALNAMRLSAEGGAEAGVRALALWYRTGEGPVTIDLAEAQRWQQIADGRKWGLKKFTVPAFWWLQSTRTPVAFFIRDPTPSNKNTLEDEIYRTEVIDGIRLPDDVKNSFRQLWTIAADNKVSFSDLCVYALGAASGNPSSERIFAPRIGADKAAVVVQSLKDGSFINLPFAQEAVQAEWARPGGKQSIRTAFEETAKRSSAALDSMVALAERLDGAMQSEAAELAITVVLDQATPINNAKVIAADHFKRGRYREHAGRYQDALLDYMTASVLQPDNATYANQFGYTRLQHDIALPATADLLERAARLAPDDIDIRESVGWAYVKTNRVEDGLALLRQVIAAMPDSPEPYAHLADGLRRLGRADEARDALAAAEARKPSDSMTAFIAQQRTLLGQ